MPEISSELLKYAALIVTFGAVASVVYSILAGRSERAGIRSGIDDVMLANPAVSESRAAVMRFPFARRVLLPTGRGLASLVYRFGPKGIAEKTRNKIVHAGLDDRLTVDAFLAFTVTAPIVMTALLFMVAQLGVKFDTIVWGLVPLSAYAPTFWLNGRVAQRQKEIRLALADTLDLLMIAVEAGLGFDAALARVVGTLKGPLSDELYRMLQELRIGIDRAAALRNLSARTNIPDLDQFITAMNQAEAFGLSVGNVLRVQSQELRRKRTQAAEEQAGKVPVKLLLPLLLCIFPCIFVVLVGPAAIQIAEQFVGT